MILVVGAVASGKRTYARSLGFGDSEIVVDAQELVRDVSDITALADALAGNPIVLCTEIGSGIVPLDAAERAWRERAGRLSIELASRADIVVRMVCGIPTVLKDVTGARRPPRRVGLFAQCADLPSRCDRCLTPVTSLELTLIRHGQTPGNAERRYVGSADDQPLSTKGRAQAQAAGPFPDVRRVYVSPLRRARETASIMFPDVVQVVVEGVQEMDFGAFTGRSADEMADDPAYRAWVAGGCVSQCPGGESRIEFEDRVCRALERLLRDAAARGEQHVALVAHGGTMMAALKRFTGDARPYHEWLLGNCEAYRIKVDLTGECVHFEVLDTVRESL